MAMRRVPPSEHRITGIDREVKNREFELIAINLCWRRSPFFRDLQRNPRAQRSLEHFFDTACQGEDVERLRIKVLLSREGKEAPD